MPRKTEDTRPEIIYCACGCGEIVPRTKYPSQQRRYLNFHQHRGEHNGNYKGGGVTLACSVCGQSFKVNYAQKDVRRTCGNDECSRTWQGLVTAARGQHKVETTCAHCGKVLFRFPSQIKEKNFCNRLCMIAHYPKQANLNGHWKGGRWKFVREQIMLRDEYRCVICGFDYQVHVHHITPVSEDGTNDFSNLITLCPNHHAMADMGVINLEQWRNHEWTPAVAIVQGAAIITDRRANRSHTRRERIDSQALYPESANLRQALGLDAPSDNYPFEPPD